MQINLILILVAAALLLRLIAGTRWFAVALAAMGIGLIFVLQPEMPIRYLGFWLPVMTIALVILTWAIVTPREDLMQKGNLLALLFITGLVLALSATRYSDFGQWSGMLRPAPFQSVLICLSGLIAAGALILSFLKEERRTGSYSFMIGLLLILFVLVKSPSLNHWVGLSLRVLSSQSRTAPLRIEIRWLGYSYIAFRLLHVLRDKQNGRNFRTNLLEFVNFVLFFPTLSAGPIDRLERFIVDYQKLSLRDHFWDDLFEGTKRILVGLFRKFVLADTLALIALNSKNLQQTETGGWLWILLYAYTLQIYFDFSGYSDIAIGIARIIGIKTPENFNAPYLKSNLTLFWNNWHMTLTKWVQSYVFNPLTRKLRSRQRKIPAVLVMFIGQIATMVVIGLWHGISLNFLIWGLWHGLGLFVQNRWSGAMKGRFEQIESKGFGIMAKGLGIFVTFNYVALGWVWFALPDTAESVYVLTRLFGMGT